ncbi:DUF397 domain-containing protein [Streptomyces sp. NPDC046465]|uniref:DUF397 domain-containing protein n=1 Tax=Streptomyces sp. NPDC046465 TaxID=3155810 RepID=UPI0033E33E6F
MTVQWQKSSFSGAGGENCVELARHAPHTLVRESDTPHATLTVTPDGLAALIRTCKAERWTPGQETETACSSVSIRARASRP